MSSSILLVGQPNCGKTTLFNSLTGSMQKTGNYPGVTVEKRRGFLELQSEKIEVVDLPGIYGMYPSSIDEKISVEQLKSSDCLLYTSPSPRDKRQSRMPSSA